MDTIGSGKSSLPDTSTTQKEIDALLCQHIDDFLAENSMVKLEAALTQLVYEQFKSYYQQADELEKQAIEDEMNKHIPHRKQIKSYLAGETVCLHYLNTMANFFDLPYLFCNYDPASNLQNQATS